MSPQDGHGRFGLRSFDYQLVRQCLTSDPAAFEERLLQLHGLNRAELEVALTMATAITARTVQCLAPDRDPIEVLAELRATDGQLALDQAQDAVDGRPAYAQGAHPEAWRWGP